MEPTFTVTGRISKPVHDVYEAIVDPDKLSHFFTTGGAKGRLETGSVVTWDFHDFPGAFPVKVVEVEQDQRIVLRWAAMDGATNQRDNETTVTMTFEELEDGRTLVQISEAGFNETENGKKASYGNCEGWTGMLIAMKMWLEHDIHMRQGFYA